jgi:hypothetical protein
VTDEAQYLDYDKYASVVRYVDSLVTRVAVNTSHNLLCVADFRSLWTVASSNATGVYLGVSGPPFETAGLSPSKRPI